MFKKPKTGPSFTPDSVRIDKDETKSKSSDTDLVGKSAEEAAEEERMLAKKRIAIIGGGASGLPAIKSCLEEGLEPICFERTTDIGGLWNYRENLAFQNQATVMKSTVINTSKEIMAYSDYPPLPEYPIFMHNKEVNEYLHSYADQFNLQKYIRFEIEVTKMCQADDFESSGRWVLRFSDGSEETFDAVMICTGHHATPYKAPIAGIEEFEGTVIHSQQYTEPSGLKDKSVLVVGMGNSAVDIAVELGKSGNEVYLSTRRGSWVWNRISRNGIPFDIKFLTRAYDLLRNVLPWAILNNYMEHLLNTKVDHEVYGLKPKHRFFEQHPTANDHLPNSLASGLVMLRGDVKGVENGNTVLFENDQRAKIDVIILCTGYTFGYQFLEPKNLIEVNQNQVDLYKYVFPPKLSPSTVAVIGLIQPYGSIMPISEMQTRWASRVFAKKSQLPRLAEMQKDIIKKRKALSDRFYPSQKHTVQVEFIQCMDELANQIGAKPALLKLMMSDPQLWAAAMIGPNVPYFYRLVGPNIWPDARKTILSTTDRLYAHLKGRKVKVQSHKKWSFLKSLQFFFAKQGIFVLFCFLAAAFYVVISFGLGWAGPITTFVFTLVFLLITLYIISLFNFHFDFSTIY